MKVMRAFQSHYPIFFKDKSVDDKKMLLVEWMQIFGQEDDRIFLKACGNVAKEGGYFPSPQQISKAIASVKRTEEFERLQAEYKRKQDEEWANLSEDQIKMLEDIDSFFGGERIDWHRIKSEAQDRLIGAMI